MTHTCKLKSNDNREGELKRTILPLPPELYADLEMEIYSRFMRHLRMVPNSRAEIKVLSAIQFTADIMDIGDALVAKALVDLGLRAPRKAFPASYLEHADKSLMRSGWEVGGPDAGILALKSYWDEIGEDPFAAVRRDYPVAEIPMTT